MKKPSKPSRKRYQIHFICTGNTYRSRLAEAYLKSFNLKGIRVSSSGIEASKHEHGPISWYAARIAAYQGLLKYVSKYKKETQEKHLQNANLVIFMHQDNYMMFQKYFGNLSLSKYEVWDIPDLHHLGIHNSPTNLQEEQIFIKATEKTFAQIKDNVNKLAEKLQSA